MTVPSNRPASDPVALVAGVLLIAACLRAPFTGLPPVLGAIQADAGLGASATGALTTLPLLAFAIVSPFSARLGRALGLERALFAALIVIALGIAVRSAGATWALFAGAGLIGLGIAIGNVLLPSLVKRDFPDRVTSITGAYALAMGVMAAVGSAAIVPLAHAWGWRAALAAFLVLPAAAAALWATQLRMHSMPTADTADPSHGGAIWRSPLAWQVTLFLGLNSTIYYVAIGWLPAILVDGGMTPAQAGSTHGALQLATALPGLLLAPLLRRMRDQCVPAAAAAGLSTIALVGLLAWPQLALAWAVLFGVGTGAGIILGLAFIGLRTRGPDQAATLSGMSQCVGYLLAAVGPTAVGALHDARGSWTLPLLSCVVVGLVAVVMGLLAGRDRHVDGRR